MNTEVTLCVYVYEQNAGQNNTRPNKSHVNVAKV